MDRSLNSLSSAFRIKVERGLAKLVERQVMVLIVQTSRTLEEAAANIANGTSQSSHSKHLPRKLRGMGFQSTDPDFDKADAIDLCPYLVYQRVGADKLAWDLKEASPEVKAAALSDWKAIGDVGETLDLRWGGRWWTNKEKGLIGFDPGHWELILSPVDRRLVEGERIREWRTA